MKTKLLTTTLIIVISTLSFGDEYFPPSKTVEETGRQGVAIGKVYTTGFSSTNIPLCDIDNRQISYASEGMNIGYLEDVAGSENRNEKELKFVKDGIELIFTLCKTSVNDYRLTLTENILYDKKGILGKNAEIANNKQPQKDIHEN